jgi:hypothetical protein
MRTEGVVRYRPVRGRRARGRADEAREHGIVGYLPHLAVAPPSADNPHEMSARTDELPAPANPAGTTRRSWLPGSLAPRELKRLLAQPSRRWPTGSRNRALENSPVRDGLESIGA